MMWQGKFIQEIYGRQGEFLGLLIGPELWEEVKEKVEPLLHEALGVKQSIASPEASEPIQDWETLKKYWDFPYPLDVEVACSNCGNATSDWQKDDPRKFRLKAASLGGLVTFECLQCRARVIKRHFKDKVKVEVHPYKP